MNILSKKNEKKLLLSFCLLLSVFLIVAVWQLFSLKEQYEEFIELVLTSPEEAVNLIELPEALSELEKGVELMRSGKGMKVIVEL